MSDDETEPIPSAMPGWYVANETGSRVGYTSDPEQAKRREVSK